MCRSVPIRHRPTLRVPLRRVNEQVHTDLWRGVLACAGCPRRYVRGVMTTPHRTAPPMNIHNASPDPPRISAALAADVTDNCPICDEGRPSRTPVLACGHSICESCYEVWLEHGSRKCPLCLTSASEIAAEVPPASASAKDKTWGVMTQEEQDAAARLGFDGEMWDEGISPEIFFSPWNQLPP
eukprot:43304-Prymnesium_polylepis.1